MRAVLRYDPATKAILQVCWTSTTILPQYGDEDGNPLPNQAEVDVPETVRTRLALEWEEVGDAIQTACELSEDGTKLIRKSTGETLSPVTALEA